MNTRSELLRTLMTMDLKIIGNSAVLITPVNCLLFNPMEGIQRNLMQAKVKIEDVDNVFLTSQNDSSGLFGMMMTCSNLQRHTSIHAHNMSDYVKDLSIFTESRLSATLFDYVRTDLGSEIMKEPEIKDFSYKGRLKSRLDSQDGLVINSESFFYEDYFLKVFPLYFKKNMNKKRKLSENPNLESDSTICSYAIHLPDFRGKINAELLEKYKIPKQNIRILAKNGTLEIEGKRITLPMISDAPRLGRMILLLFCPQMEYMTSLVTNDSVQLYKNKFPNREILVVHFTTSDIYNSNQYQLFLNEWKNTTHHFSDTATYYGLPTYQAIKQNLSISTKYFTESSGLHWKNSFAYFEVYPNIKKSLPVYSQLKSSKKHTFPLDVPVITSYGTGSATPQIIRNVSGYCLYINEMRVLLDPGEDTLRSILTSIRHESHSDVENDRIEAAFWKSVKFIFVSHNHADHHSGIQNIIKRYCQYADDNLILVVSPKLAHFLSSRLDKSLSLYKSKISLHLTPWYVSEKNRKHFKYRTFDFTLHNPKKVGSLRKHIQLETIPVNHQGQATACRISSNGFSVAYSGDTTYCSEMVQLSQNCDLLIHEATFEDFDSQNAKKKNHSCLSDAIKVFKESKSKRLLLTHFSQKMKELHPTLMDLMIKKHDYKITAALDGLQLPITDIDFKEYSQKLPHYRRIIYNTNSAFKSQPTLE